MIDQSQVLKMLLDAEKGINRAGWGQPPRLYSVFNWRPKSLYIEDSLVPLQDPIANHLLGLADVYERTPQLARAIALAPGMIGVAVSSEGWGVTRPVAEMAPLKARVTATTPGRFEVRMLTVVDIWGRVSHVQRTRGEKPRADGELRGSNVVIALTKILTQFAPYIEGADPAALKKLLAHLEHTRLRPERAS